MIKGLARNIDWKDPASVINQTFHAAGILGKVAGEELGLFKTDTFTKPGSDAPEAE